MFLSTLRPSNLRGCRLCSAFAEVCNALAPEVQRTRVWNRVALHHMHYRALREKFPALGSQMVCNAIYAVSRTSRMVFQMPATAQNKLNIDLVGIQLHGFEFTS